MKEGIDMEMNDPRIENLRRASAMTRQQQTAIMNRLNAMNNEEVNNLLSENEELRDFVSIDADSDNSGIVVNYANQPQNGNNNQISFQAPWEGNLSTNNGYQPQPQMNLFQNNGFYNGGNVYNMQNDSRIQVYNQHPGMRFYNINPYYFIDGTNLLDFYNHLEEEREKKVNLNYVLIRFGARANGNPELIEWAEQFKFKPADDIIREQYEEQQRIEEERRREIYGEDGNKTVYDVYDSNGYRFQRVRNFRLVNIETNEVVFETHYRKDEDGQAYVIKSRAEDNKQAYEIQQLRIAFYQDAIFKERFREMFYQQQEEISNKWRSWKEQGLTPAEMWDRQENLRVDWKKQEKLIQRIFMTASYSHEKFSDILKKCCNTELKYSGKSSFFSLSYDFERDMHYKELTSTPEELENDPRVHEKLKQEYEIKRKLFMDKVNSGNLGCNMMIDANARPTIPKPNIAELTLEDYDKPENQIMYSAISCPERATPNYFIPENKSVKLSEEEILAMNGIKLDKNGQVIPQKRTIGFMTVDDDTGEILAQEEFDVATGNQGRVASNDMTDEELIDAGF
jgi:hypothetical protein